MICPQTAKRHEFSKLEIKFLLVVKFSDDTSSCDQSLDFDVVQTIKTKSTSNDRERCQNKLVLSAPLVIEFVHFTFYKLHERAEAGTTPFLSLALLQLNSIAHYPNLYFK